MKNGCKLCCRFPKLTIFLVAYLHISAWFLFYSTEKKSNNLQQLQSQLVSAIHVAAPLPNLTSSSQHHFPKRSVIIKSVSTDDKNNETARTFSFSCSMQNYLKHDENLCNLVSKNGTPSESKRDNSCDLNKVISDCNNLRNSYLYGKDKLSKQEELFPLAFAMKIHSSPNQAHRLLRFLYQPHHVFCIHIDKKSPLDIHNDFKTIASCFSNIHIIENRTRVIYSTITQVEAELKCMEAMMNAKQKWKYYINLTGQEFLLKTNLELVRILTALNGSNDIESYPVAPHEKHKITQKIILGAAGPITSTGRKEPFHNITIHKGSAYGLFSREFVTYVLTDPFVEEFLMWLKDIYSPEEFIWATLESLPGTPGSRRRTFHDKDETFFSRAVKWEMDGTQKCEGKYVRWICIYGVGDVPWLLRNRNIVANKFHDNFQPLALDCVEKEMYMRLVEGKVGEHFNEDTYKALIQAKYG